MHFHLVQKTSKTLPDAGLVASVSVRTESNIHMGLMCEDAITLKK